MIDSGEIPMHYKLPLLFEPQPEGGFTVTSPLLPELVTEGDSVEDALENVRDALAAVIEAYQEMGRALPPHLVVTDPTASVWADTAGGLSPPGSGTAPRDSAGGSPAQGSA